MLSMVPEGRMRALIVAAVVLGLVHDAGSVSQMPRAPLPPPTRVTPHTRPDAAQVELRQYLMLRYAEGLGRSEGLWQLGAAYLTDVLGELPHMAADRAADVRAKVSERLERLLVSEARRGAHALRVRKLLSVCERHALPEIAQKVVKEAAARKR